MTPSTPLRPAVFLDRDGTLIREVDYLADPDAIQFLPGAIEGLQALRDAGFALVLVTNQSGIARGLVTVPVLEQIHARIVHELAEFGVELQGIEWCPHHPTEGNPPFVLDCECRKPKPGMLLMAAEDHGLDLATSWTIGDAPRDLDAGLAAGTQTVLVRTGKGGASESSVPVGTAVVDDLAAAAQHVLAAAQTR